MRKERTKNREQKMEKKQLPHSSTFDVGIDTHANINSNKTQGNEEL